MEAAKKEVKISNGDTSWFCEARFGMFIHWGLYSLAARHEWVKQREKISDADYRKYFERFDPDLYDPAAWARAAKQAGMRYVVLTAKHHEGFCLWDSAHTAYKVTNTPCGRDLVKPYAEAFRSEGLRVGLYYSLLDWHHPDYTTDRWHPQQVCAERRAGDGKRDMRKYAAYMRDQVRELLTGYGDIDILWFDFSFPGEDGKGCGDWESEKLYKLVRELRPGIMVDNRLDLPGSGDFETPEQFQPRSALVDKAGNPVVWEACQTFSDSWGYHRDEQDWRSTDELLRALIDCVSKNGNLLLNVGPTARGEFDHRALDRLGGIGRWMHSHARAVYGCGAAPADLPRPEGCRYTYNPAARRLYLHIFDWPYKTLHLDGLGDRIAYAQLLHDASEVRIKVTGTAPQQEVSLSLPQTKPPVEIPVVELFLK